MAQWLRVCSVLAEGPGSAPITYGEADNHVLLQCPLTLRASTGTRHTCGANIHTHNKNMEKGVI